MNVWLDIILPTCNNSDLTIRYLDSLERTTAPGTYRIIWVDNGSHPDQYAAVKKRLQAMEDKPPGFSVPWHCIWSLDRLGFVRAVNLALKKVCSPYVVIQNNDVELFTDVYGRMMQHLDRDPKPGLVGPVSTSGWQRWQNLAGFTGQPTLDALFNCRTDEARAQFLYTRFPYNSVLIGSMLAFFCVMGKREVFQEIGPLSLEYGDGFGDDDDYCEEVKKRGRTLRLALDCLVYHQHRSTFRTIYTDQQIAEQQAKNIAFFKQKWGKE